MKRKRNEWTERAQFHVARRGNLRSRTLKIRIILMLSCLELRRCLPTPRQQWKHSDTFFHKSKIEIRFIKTISSPYFWSTCNLCVYRCHRTSTMIPFFWLWQTKNTTYRPVIPVSHLLAAPWARKKERKSKKACQVQHKFHGNVNFVMNYEFNTPINGLWWSRDLIFSRVLLVEYYIKNPWLIYSWLDSTADGSGGE